MKIIPSRTQHRVQPAPVEQTTPNSTRAESNMLLLDHSPIRGLSTLAQQGRSALPYIQSLGTAATAGTAPKTCHLDDFNTLEQQVGVAAALIHSDRAYHHDGALSAYELQHLFPNTFGDSEATSLSALMNKAKVQLQQEHLLNQGDRPGLVIAIKGRTKNLAAHSLNDGKEQRQQDIEQVITLLQTKGIRPNLYTGHKIGGELAQWAHKKMDDPLAVTISFDAETPTLTHTLNQINVPIDKKGKDLGELLQERAFLRLLENTRIRLPAPQPAKREISTANIRLNDLPLRELLRCDPMALVDKIGKSDRRYPLNIKELSMMTDMIKEGDTPDKYQALLLHYVGKIYKAVNRGPQGVEQFLERLFTPPEVLKALGGARRTQALREEAQSLFKGIDLSQFKALLEQEIKREVQAYAFESRIITILQEITTQLSAENAADSAVAEKLSTANQALTELAEQALELYNESGYLRLLTGTGGKAHYSHATAFTLEKVQTDKGEENLATLFNSGDHALRGDLKTPASDGHRAKYHAHPQAYVGVNIGVDHLLNLIKSMYNFHLTLPDIIHSREFETLTPEHIRDNLAHQEGVRPLDFRALPLDQGQKSDSCSIKSSQAPAKAIFPFLIRLVKVTRLVDTLENITRQHQQIENQVGEQAQTLRTIEARGQQQLVTHTAKMMTILRAKQTMASNETTRKGQVPPAIPEAIQALAQRAGDWGISPFKALPYQQNNLQQVELLHTLAQSYHRHRGSNSTGLSNMLSALSTLRQQAQQNQAYLKETGFAAAAPQYHREAREASAAFANQLLERCQDQAIALRIYLGKSPTIMLLKGGESLGHFQVALLTQNLAEAHRHLKTQDPQQQEQTAGIIRLKLTASIFSTTAEQHRLRDLVFSASSANKNAAVTNARPNLFNKPLRLSILGDHAQQLRSKIFNHHLPPTAPAGLLLMDMLSQYQLGKNSEDYRQVFGSYTQQLQKEAAAVRASTGERATSTSPDPRYSHIVALADQLSSKPHSIPSSTRP